MPHLHYPESRSTSDKVSQTWSRCNLVWSAEPVCEVIETVKTQKWFDQKNYFQYNLGYQIYRPKCQMVWENVPHIDTNIKGKRELKMVPLMCNQHCYRYFDLFQPFSNTVRLLHDIWVYAICSFFHFFHFHCCPGKTGCDVKQGNYISSLKWKPS